MVKFIIAFIILFVETEDIASAQNHFKFNKQEFNRLDSNGNKVGIWIPGYKDDYFSKHDIVVSEYSVDSISGTSNLTRLMTFRKGKIASDNFFIEGKLKSANEYVRRKLYRTYSYSLQTEPDSSKSRRYVLNGTVHLYNKSGKLALSAYYEQGIFKHVIFHSNKRVLKRFLNKDQDNLNIFIDTML